MNAECVYGSLLCLVFNDEHKKEEDMQQDFMKRRSRILNL
jgi:hypothetical protein